MRRPVDTDGSAARARPAGFVPAGAWGGAAGVLLGAAACLADGAPGVVGAVGVTLSLPGAWLAACVAVVLLAVRHPDSPLAVRPRATTGAVAATAFLVTGMAAYYVGKQLVAGAVPGPLVVFWVLLAGVLGLAGGAVAARLAARPTGRVALIAGAVGWLVAETLLVPSAPPGDAVVAMAAGSTLLARRRADQRLAPMALGALTGAVAAAAVISALPAALSALV